MHRYKMRSDWPASSSAKRDMGVALDHKLGASQDATEKRRTSFGNILTNIKYVNHRKCLFHPNWH